MVGSTPLAKKIEMHDTPKLVGRPEALVFLGVRVCSKSEMLCFEGFFCMVRANPDPQG